MLEEQELAGGVHVAALPASRVPRVADLDAVDLCDDVVIARGTDHRSGGELADGPRQHAALLLAFARGRDVGEHLVGSGHAGVPELPETAVEGGGGEVLRVLESEWLEADAVTLQRDRLDVNHDSRSQRGSWLEAPASIAPAS